jgi:hypothetical protein
VPADDGGIRVLVDEPPPDRRVRRRGWRGAVLPVTLALVVLAAVAATVYDRVRAPTPSRTLAGLPQRLDPTRPAAIPLRRNPIERARLLVQPYGSPDIFALAEDGSWRRIDVVPIAPVTDVAGNVQPALDVTSLSADGRRAAFAQRDEVLVVDLSDASLQRIPLPGFNEDVRWIGDGLAVAQDGVTFFMVPPDAGPVELTGAGRDVAVADEAGIVTVSLDASHRPVLRRWGSDGAGPPQLFDGTGVLYAWDGPGWRRGRVIARGALEAVGDIDAPAGAFPYRVVLIDLAAGVARYAPGPPPMPPDKARLLGWRDANTLLVAVERQRIMAYDVTTGAGTELAVLAAESGVLSLSQRF